ncbi:hypothetical protein ISCGN_029545 [Ixodes scapularis]
MGDAKEDYPVFSVSKMKPRSWLFRVWNERTTWRTASPLQVFYSNKRQWWSQRTKFEHEETKNAAKPKKNPPSLFDKQSAHTRTHTHTFIHARVHTDTRAHTQQTCAHKHPRTHTQAHARHARSASDIHTRQNEGSDGFRRVETNCCLLREPLSPCFLVEPPSNKNCLRMKERNPNEEETREKEAVHKRSDIRRRYNKHSNNTKEESTVFPASFVKVGERRAPAFFF